MGLSYFIDLLNKILGRGCLLYGATPLKQLGHIEKLTTKGSWNNSVFKSELLPLKCNVVICLFVVPFN